ncbi:MAG: radical SAM protein [Myxococcales bacterium]|nr:radical SAM protein [Myxococcota bacterium]MDW8281104.1 radical SAM protein [Myxococcales bacterium]
MSWVISMDRAQALKVRGKNLVRRAGLPVMQRIWNQLPEWVHHPYLTMLGVALTRICNADCTFCAYQFLSREERRHMPDDIFERVVEEVAALRVPHIHLSPNLGDPLVAPRLLDKIAALRRAGVQLIYLTTNGILLERIGISEFLEHGPDIIGISTSGFDEEMYRRVYRSKQYHRMRAGVLQLLRENHARPPERRRYISIRIRADRPKEEFLRYPDMEEIIRLADDVKYNEMYGDWGGLIKPEMLTGDMRLRPMVPHTNRPCAQLYNLAVHPDGEILACACQNIHHDAKMSLGNIRHIGLAQAWRRLGHLTAAWKQGEMPDTCRRCSMYNDPAAAWPGLLRQALVHLRLRGPREVLETSLSRNAVHL